MLQLKSIYNNQEKIDFFQKHFDENVVWVVATAEAKRRLQFKNLYKKGIVSTQNVLRATEYWSYLFQTNCSEQQQISEPLIFVMLENWYKLAKIDIEFQDIQQFKTFCDQIIPILISTEKKLFYDWLKEDNSRFLRLQKWVNAAEGFLAYISKNHFVGQSWILNSILKKENIYFGEQKKYVFDLGNEIQPEEVQMILRMSSDLDITVLAPSAQYLKNYRSGRCYQKLDSQYGVVERTDQTEKKWVLRSGSVLSEIKTITAYVRDILEKGNSAEKIAIISSDLENYWDSLRDHFDVEGIAIDKSTVVKIASLPHFHDWLARLKILTNMYTSGDLESFLNAKGFFSKNKNAYLDFRKNFSRLYSLDSAGAVLGEVITFDPDKVISFSDFISFLYVTWTHSDYQQYNQLVDGLIKDFKEGLSLSLKEWSTYLNLILAKMEIVLHSPNRKGIVFCGPHQLDHLKYTHLIVLGCDRSSMQKNTNSPFVPEDVSRLDSDLGYYLPPCEDKKVEFDILWAASHANVDVLFSYAETDFNSDPTIVSQLWLTWSQQAQWLEVSRGHRWGQIMKSEIKGFQQTAEGNKNTQQEKWLRENDLSYWQNLQLPFAGRLSVSAFEKYQFCPFAFFATRVLKQQEVKELDLEIDPLFQGSFLHKILEIMLFKYPTLNMTSMNIESLYDEVIVLQQKEAKVSEEILQYWKREKYRHLLMIRLFIKAEKEWRMNVPNTNIDSLEAVLSGYVGISENQLVLTQKHSEGFLPFAAKIDRVDRDRFGHLAVFDYKTSKPADFKSFEKWPETFQIQMPLYAMGIENGLSEQHKNQKVVMANYIFLKDGSRGSGFVLQGIEHGFQSAATVTTSKQNISTEQRDSVFDLLNDKIKTMLVQIQEGRFLAQPLDEKQCTTCHWRKLCRAPHLK